MGDSRETQGTEGKSEGMWGQKMAKVPERDHRPWQR